MHDTKISALTQVGGSTTLSAKTSPNHDGFRFAFGAFFLWGLLPLYWKFLKVLPATMILSYRIVCSVVFLALAISIRKGWSDFFRHLKHPRECVSLVANTLLIGFNWWLYIWAVNSGFVLETSLGYFMNPLVSVALGCIFLKERLNLFQSISILIVILAVLNLLLHHGQFPWIAVSLALSFGFYGLLRKANRKMDSLASLFSETAIMAPVCLYFLIQLPAHPEFASAKLTLLLIGSGIVTALPMYFFGEAARRLGLSTLGICQYLAPSIQFLLAIFAFREEPSSLFLTSFILVWLAIGIFLWGSFLKRASA